MPFDYLNSISLQGGWELGERPKVNLRGLTKEFGAVRAVAGIDLEIRQGEFLTLLGPSGCGKTTTLMILAGFEEPTAGEVWIDGANVTALPPYRRPVNTVFQTYALFPHMTVFENVAFALRMQRTPKSEIRSRVEEHLELVQLSGYERRYPRQLSGGQQQRVALARAIIARPEVLLLDEPLGALDLRLRRNMQVELKGLQRRLGMAFVYVTHDQEEALTMSDRIAVMHEGRIEQIGTGAEIYERPRTRFVAEFIGETNLLPARVHRETTGERTADVLGLCQSLDPSVDPALEGELFASVRPERIRQADPSERAFSGGVVDRIYVGAGVKVLVRVEGHDSPVRVLCAPNSELARVGLGDELRLTWNSDDMVLLP